MGKVVLMSIEFFIITIVFYLSLEISFFLYIQRDIYLIVILFF